MNFSARLITTILAEELVLGVHLKYFCTVKQKNNIQPAVGQAGASGEVTGTIEMDSADMLKTLTGKGQTFKRWSTRQ